MKIQRIANAGLLVDIAMDTGEACFAAIDCFCHDPQQFYRDTTLQEKSFLMELIRRKQLNMLIFTHEHGDHFYAPDVLTAWRANPELLILSNHVVTEFLYTLGIPKENMITVGGSAERGVSWICMKNIRLGCMITQHDGKEYKDVKNIAVLIEGASERIVVTGDAMPSSEFFERVHSWSPQIDRMYLPFPYVGLPSVRSRMVHSLKIEEIYVLHQPRPEADTGHWIEAARRACKQWEGETSQIFWL